MGDIAPLFTSPAVHLLAEVVIPVPIGQDFNTVFTSTLFMALPVIWLSEVPVPKKVSQRKLRAQPPYNPAPAPKKHSLGRVQGLTIYRLGNGAGAGRKRLGKLAPRDPEECIEVKASWCPWREQGQALGEALTCSCFCIRFHPPISRSHPCQ